ncbi:MAG: hypothetical protein M1608_10415 [Candidatus Omnitrophica bacterium]|nr:hypothetical protein [Candidatus Omnitrophota bacterium]
MSGRTVDSLSGRPIAHARIAASLRLIAQFGDHVSSLRSLSEVQPLASTFTDADGVFRFELFGLGETVYCRIDAEATGYLDQTDTLASLGADRLNQIDFELVREKLDQAELDDLNELHLLRKASLYLQNPSFQQGPEPPRTNTSSSAATSGLPSTTIPQGGSSVPAVYPVPTKVRVEALAGSGFTGLMDLDELIAGTVSAETGDGFPLEALKAQAVASRTYALDRWSRRGYANGGQAYTATVGRKSRVATVNSGGIVLLYQGALITAYFSARCNGDFTLNSEEGPTLSNCQLGGLGAGVVPWARARPCSGHANCAETSEPCCQLVVRGATNYVYGHGVGMCQRGAQQFAGLEGWDWQRILTNYYTGIAIANLPGLAVNTEVVTVARVNVRNAPCGGTVIATQDIDQDGIIVGGPERPVCSLASPNSYFTWWEVLFRSGVRGWAVEDYLSKAAVASPVPVELGFRRGQDGLLLFWPTNWPYWKLQSASSLTSPVNWLDLTNMPAIADGLYQVEFDTPKSNIYYRLSSD